MSSLDPGSAEQRHSASKTRVIALMAPHRVRDTRTVQQGKSLICLSSPICKNIFISFRPKSPAYNGRLIPHEGALAIVTNVGMGCGGRRCAFDEQRRSRTAKSCGPDAPMLASSRAEVSARRRWQQSRSPGRARYKPLKPLRREGRTASAEPVCSCALFAMCIGTRDRGCSAHPVFPAPSDYLGQGYCKTRAQRVARRRTRISSSLRGAERRSNPALSCGSWIASRSLSSGGHSPDPLARNDDLSHPPLPGQGEVGPSL